MLNVTCSIKVNLKQKVILFYELFWPAFIYMNNAKRSRHTDRWPDIIIDTGSLLVNTIVQGRGRVLEAPRGQVHLRGGRHTGGRGNQSHGKILDVFPDLIRLYIYTAVNLHWLMYP